MIRILIVDNHNSVLENLKVLLESEAEFVVVGSARDSHTGIELAQQLQPDLVIVDPFGFDDGIDCVCTLVRQANVIAYTDSPQHLNQAILAGVRGYLLKNSSIIDLTAAIYAVRRDNVYIGKGILDRLQLASVDSQKSKLQDMNLWLAKEIIHWWRDLIPVRDSVAEEMMDNLNFSRAGISQMKQHLCHQPDSKASLTEAGVAKIEELFAEITKADRPQQKLKEDKQLILNLLDENGIERHAYTNTLQDNFNFLYGVTSKNVSEAIYAIARRVSPLPLLAFFQSTQKYLSDWQQYLERESQESSENRKSALISFERVRQSKKEPLQKLDICKKAAILALQSQIEAEVCGLTAQIVAEAISQFGMQIEILNQTNSFLLEAIAQLQPRKINPAVLSLYTEQLPVELIEELQHSLESAVGQPLNQWGVSTVNCTQITELLLAKLEPITNEIYTDLRREALAISFLEYAGDNYYE